MTEAAFFAFFMVFLRCSAMFLTSPVFGAQNTPLNIRIFTGVAVSGALTMVIKPNLGPVPTTLYDLLFGAFREVLAGILLGSFVSLSMQALSIAGALMDLQTGLGSSHVLNPLNGVQTSVLSQFKAMLAVVVFLAADAHHYLIAAFVRSYAVFPTFGNVEKTLVDVMTQLFLLSVQIAAPVMAVGFLIDATLALLSRAVPQIQAMQVGMPAKIGAGLATVALGLPMTVALVNSAIGASFNSLQAVFHK
ncbi:MAG TPA: flagellar biosynthetic protein FliR [Fimbriimonas sp.]|nr:flagellar biosynthetic protein FliR [Fimbriimonas sp.]